MPIELPLVAQCTLDPGALEIRKEEWTSLGPIERRSDDSGNFYWWIPRTPGLLTKVADLVEKEAQCCAGVTFEIVAHPTEIAVYPKLTGASLA
jgi:hypothetical protein